MSKDNRVSDQRLKAGSAGLTSDEISSIITELQFLRSKPVGVEVKPLEWAEDEAQTPFGKYRVYRTDDGYGVSFEHDELVHVGFNSVLTFESPRENAMSYAQPDYRQRILSTLSPPARELKAEEVPLIMRLVAVGNAMVGWADLSTPEAQVEWMKWRAAATEALTLSTAALKKA